MTAIEKLNLDDGLTLPEIYNTPDLCRFCCQTRGGQSMLSPPNIHPVIADVRKCKLHNCWVEADGICPDYSMYPRGPLAKD